VPRNGRLSKAAHRREADERQLLEESLDELKSILRREWRIRQDEASSGDVRDGDD
jgi:hypothetical protein